MNDIDDLVPCSKCGACPTKTLEGDGGLPNGLHVVWIAGCDCDLEDTTECEYDKENGFSFASGIIGV
jgi:hypothetical protein